MKVLFLCSSNIFRSQMAEALFNTYSKLKNEKHKAKSAALIKPQEKMHRLVIRAMKEKNLDISKNTSKKLTKKMLEEANLIVLMNPNLKKELEKLKLKKTQKVLIWEFPDVVAKETDEHLYPKFVNTRNAIEKKIVNLLNTIKT